MRTAMNLLFANQRRPATGRDRPTQNIVLRTRALGSLTSAFCLLAEEYFTSYREYSVR
jgi:hypothetical protein